MAIRTFDVPELRHFVPRGILYEEQNGPSYVEHLRNMTPDEDTVAGIARVVKNVGFSAPGVFRVELEGDQDAFDELLTRSGVSEVS